MKPLCLMSVLLAIDWALALTGLSTGVREYCEWEAFNATCGTNEVIVIETARYGRMALGRCVTKNYGHIGCGTDVTSDFDKTCSGRKSCQISVISLHTKRSCPNDFKSYLEASYKCVKVEVPVNHTCPSQGFIRLPPREGVIASSTAYSTSLGFADCPWRIRVEPHQKINLTMLDFSAFTSIKRWHGSTSTHSRATCRDYVVIREPKIGTNRTICGGRSREEIVYESQTNTIYVNVVNSATRIAKFLLHYKAVGCRPLQIAANMQLTMTTGHAVVKCNDSNQVWYLTCRDTGWIGHIGNCSPPVLAVSQTEQWSLSGVFRSSSTFPYGILIVVALGIAIGVAIGVAMLVAVMTYMKRRRRRKIRSRSNYILKQLDEDKYAKTPAAAVPRTDVILDRAPMLLNRCCPDAHRHKYFSPTHMRNRPLPTPEILPIASAAPEEEVVLAPPNIPCCSPRRIGRRSLSGFSTFKPRDGAIDSPYSPTRGNMSGNITPFYFQLDPEATSKRNSLRRDIPDEYNRASPMT